MPLSLRLVDPLLDQIFPPRCVASGAVRCASCQATTRVPEPPLCTHCGVSLGIANVSPGASIATAPLCQSCASGNGPASLTALQVAAVYDGAVRDAILALTFHRQRRAAQLLGFLLAAQIRLSGWRLDVILPVPLHPDRVRRRGCNQANLLARSCAQELRVAHHADLLLHQRDTHPQVGLTIAERHANISGAFSLASPRAATYLARRRILVVDDVATTGSTLDAATALLPVHPAAIWGLAVSRPDLASDDADASANATFARHVVKSSARHAR